jgi:hypothetical protein
MSDVATRTVEAVEALRRQGAAAPTCTEAERKTRRGQHDVYIAAYFGGTCHRSRSKFCYPQASTCSS